MGITNLMSGKVVCREGARILLENQLKGLEMLTAAGILAKINSVMIPGVNDQHLVEVNKAVKARGAFLHNIMPLISAPEHGTVFGLTGQRGPTAQELKALQDACEGDMNMMRHCRQCRADAVGLLGEDRSDEFTTEKIEQMEVQYDLATRQAYQQVVEEQRIAKREAKEAEIVSLADALDETTRDMNVLVAVGTKGEGRVNEHFGHVSEFQIYEVSAKGAKFVGHRRVDLYCQGGFGDEDALPSVVNSINDCHAVLVSKIGACPRDELKAAGIEPVERYAGEFIDQAALAWFKDYVAEIKAGTREHGARGDAAIRQGALLASGKAA